MSPSPTPAITRTRGQSLRRVALLPARLGATRLPGKPLIPIGDDPIIWHVWQNTRRCDRLDEVIVVADDPQVVEAVTVRGGQAMLIDAPCDSGTTRVALAAQQIDADLILNVQGDEPEVGPDLIEPLLDALEAGAPIATLSAPLPADRLHDRHAVKVVCDQRGHALYFSRAPIPGRLHLGLYGMTREALEAVSALPRGPLARIEDLEQLTWLEAGWPIAVAPVNRATHSIDTPADLEAARQRWAEQPQRRP